MSYVSCFLREVENTDYEDYSGFLRKVENDVNERFNKYEELLKDFRTKYKYSFDWEQENCENKNNSSWKSCAYIPDEEAMDAYRTLCCVGVSYYGFPPEKALSFITRSEFRGPDWYFFYGNSPLKRDSDGWWFETLTEKKERFQNLLEALSHIQTKEASNE